MKGLMLAIGKPEPEKGGAERQYAKEAFSAVKDDDEEGFIEAFLGAVRACSKKSKTDEYDDAETED